ncbi:MAG: PKD domain-containing protein [Euryarchaeota archaeon]|nr:PKD domain-containing protein [Euryarchaeota archaeon]
MTSRSSRFIRGSLAAILVASMLLTAIPPGVLGAAPPGGEGVAAKPVPKVDGYVDPSTVTPKFWVEPAPYTPPPATAARESGRATDAHAVLVGINAYPSSPLQGCISDITAIRDQLVNVYGWENSNIHFITDSAATPDRIISELRWLVNVTGPSGQALFSFSGHGSAHTIYAYPMNGVTDSEVAAEWVRLNSSDNVLIMDSCFSGANTAVNISQPPTVSMMACGPSETASDGNTFTKAWVEGLGTTEWGNVEQAFQYAYNKVQGWQHPVMWDNFPGDMMLGRKPPVIAPLPELHGTEDTPLSFTFTPYESDPVDGNELLAWSVGSWDPLAIRSVSGQNGQNDTLTFTPARDWYGRTNLSLVLRNSAGRTAKAVLWLSLAPVNDPPCVTRLDRFWPEVERTKEVKLVVYGGDVDDLQSTLAARVEFRPPGGDWTDIGASAEFVTNRWEVVFSPPARTPVGDADLRARLADREGWGEWLAAPAFIRILNSPPVVSSLFSAAPLVHRTLPLRVVALGSDAEDAREVLECDLSVRSQNDTRWTALRGARLENGSWEVLYTPAAGATLGPYDARARLRDLDGASGDWRVAYGLFRVENALPVLRGLELSAPSVERGRNLTVTVTGGDVEDPVAAVTCLVQYIGPAGTWALVEGVRAGPDRWTATFMPDASFRTGTYGFRANLRDSSGQTSGWFYQNSSLEVSNSPPAVSAVSFSAGSLLRGQDISVHVEGADYEDRGFILQCALEYRPPGAGDWASAHLEGPVSDPRGTAWDWVFSPPAGLPAGKYEFRSRIRDRDGDWGAWYVPERTVEVRNNLPVARIAQTAAVVNEGVPLALDGSGSSDMEGALSLGWDLGDGSTAAGESVSHSYAKGGPMTVTLTVTDSDGATATATVRLRVNLLPSAQALAAQRGGVRDFRVDFDATASVDPEGALAYCWDLDIARDTSGDGIPDNDADSISPAPTFDYRRAGTFQARLTVTDSDNATATTLLVVKVRQVDEDTGWMVTLGLVAAVMVAVAAAAAVMARRRGGRGPPGEPSGPAMP